MSVERTSSRSGRTTRSTGTGRASSRNHQQASLNPYDELLLEASVCSDTKGEGRPLKRRRVVPNASLRTESISGRTEQSDASEQNRVQFVYNDYSSSDASSFDWEEVDLDDQDRVPAQSLSGETLVRDSSSIEDITINLDHQKQTLRKNTRSRRLLSTAEEKRKRLDAHKTHLCCLLVHASLRNAWCNDETVKRYLESILSDRTKKYLNPDVSWPQFRRSHAFVEGLEQACTSFRPAFVICEKGLRKSNWSAEPAGSNKRKSEKDAEQPINLEGFRKLAQDRAGSRDTAAQLFCAVLRASGVATRLVCSLQPLPFASPAPAQSSTVQEDKETFYLNDFGGLDSNNELSDGQKNTGQVAPGPQPVKRFGGAAHSLVDYGKAPPLPAKKKNIVESKYPVYWVEVFNEALQKWHPVDPIVTRTVSKPHKLEPPASDSLNNMSYVVAFEDNGTAKDVTRRYVRAYNAKTRRSRVEITKGGARWWNRTMKLFAGTYKADRDQVEDAELAQKEASEPMPRNVQDFKDHPYYALERHLRRHEIIHPKKEIGKLSGTKALDTVEPIYRRKDVRMVQSADKWYRQGREVMTGQQPMKYGATNSRRQIRSPSPASDHNREDVESEGLGLYAEFQTQPYVPTPVRNNRIHKNAFGNLDIYVDSMIPAGAVHVRAVEAAAAAKILSLDYADAVTGFKFKGRRGTAVTTGIIVAKGFVESIQEVIIALRWQALQEAASKEGRVALALWKRFLVALRIKKRILQDADEGYEEGDKDGSQSVTEQVYDGIQQDQDMQAEGGFIPDRNQGEIAKPTARTSATTLSQPESTSGSNKATPAQRIEETLNRPFDGTVIVIYSPWDNERNMQSTQAPNKSDDSATSTNTIPAHEPDLKAGGLTRTADQTEGPTEIQATDPINELFESTSDVEHGGGFIPPLDGTFDVDPAFSLPMDHNGVQSSAAEHMEGVRIETKLTEPNAEEAGNAVLAREKEAAAAEDEQSLDRGDDTDNGGLGNEGSGDQGSLMSHDPEDEETEPQWLADETGL